MQKFILSHCPTHSRKLLLSCFIALSLAFSSLAHANADADADADETQNMQNQDMQNQDMQNQNMDNQSSSQMEEKDKNTSSNAWHAILNSPAWLWNTINNWFKGNKDSSDDAPKEDQITDTENPATEATDTDNTDKAAADNESESKENTAEEDTKESVKVDEKETEATETNTETTAKVKEVEETAKNVAEKTEAAVSEETAEETNVVAETETEKEETNSSVTTVENNTEAEKPSTQASATQASKSSVGGVSASQDTESKDSKPEFCPLDLSKLGKKKGLGNSSEDMQNCNEDNLGSEDMSGFVSDETTTNTEDVAPAATDVTDVDEVNASQKDNSDKTSQQEKSKYSHNSSLVGDIYTVQLNVSTYNLPVEYTGMGIAVNFFVDISENVLEVRVTDVMDSSDAKGKLQVGDLITAVQRHHGESKWYSWNDLTTLDFSGALNDLEASKLEALTFKISAQIIEEFRTALPKELRPSIEALDKFINEDFSPKRLMEFVSKLMTNEEFHKLHSSTPNLLELAENYSNYWATEILSAVFVALSKGELGSMLALQVKRDDTPYTYTIERKSFTHVNAQSEEKTSTKGLGLSYQMNFDHNGDLYSLTVDGIAEGSTAESSALIQVGDEILGVNVLSAEGEFMGISELGITEDDSKMASRKTLNTLLNNHEEGTGVELMVMKKSADSETEASQKTKESTNNVAPQSEQNEQSDNGEQASTENEETETEEDTTSEALEGSTGESDEGSDANSEQNTNKDESTKNSETELDSQQMSDEDPCSNIDLDSEETDYADPLTELCYREAMEQASGVKYLYEETKECLFVDLTKGPQSNIQAHDDELSYLQQFAMLQKTNYQLPDTTDTYNGVTMRWLEGLNKANLHPLTYSLVHLYVQHVLSTVGADVDRFSLEHDAQKFFKVCAHYL